jgi:L-asparagine transporter-like permease
MILLNVGVAGGLVVSYFRGAPLWIVALCGVFIFVLVNVISLIRLRKAQERSKDSN